MRWLSGDPSVNARFKERIIKASSVVPEVSGEDTYRLVRKRGLRLQGRRYDTEANEEIRPDVGCGHCCEWDTVPTDRCEMWLVRGGTPDERAQVPRRVVPGQERSLVQTHRGQGREVQGPSLRPGYRLPEEEGRLQ